MRRRRNLRGVDVGEDTLLSETTEEEGKGEDEKGERGIIIGDGGERSERKKKESRRGLSGLGGEEGFLRCATIEEIEAEKSLIERDVKERMEKTIETVRGSFNAVRTGRANPAMLDRIEVEYYGSPVSLKSIAQISTPDGSSLLVQPYDNLKAIEKAIVNSDIGLTPNNDGEVIRLSIPQLTSERRKELSKVVAKLAEEGKVAIRNIRRDAIKAYEKLEKEKKLSEDNVKDLSSDLQKVTDEYMKKIDSMQKQKEKHGARSSTSPAPTSSPTTTARRNRCRRRRRAFLLVARGRPHVELRARPLDPDALLKPGKLYFLPAPTPSPTTAARFHHYTINSVMVHHYTITKNPSSRDSERLCETAGSTCASSAATATEREALACTG
uniref:Ribosome-recycling factor, chloroplastic n=1 Tax=Ananas comosus var. bracteatus TaxID=296719 RepID=A0A6V7QCD3_ANACO|nr:unnamed protein product [Ananas comosus var. bracteatus]